MIDLKNLIFLLITTILFVSLVLATDVVVWQGQYYIGQEFQTGDYTFNFTVYDALVGGKICYSDTINLTTGQWGQWKTEQYNVSTSCSNTSKDYYLNINIGGVDQVPRRRLINFNFLRKDVYDIKKGNLLLNGVLTGGSSVNIFKAVDFVNNSGDTIFSLYHDDGENFSNVPPDFRNAVIFDILEVDNPYDVGVGFWDSKLQDMLFVISENVPKKATTIRGTLQVVGNSTVKLNDENLTLCTDYNYIDCKEGDIATYDDIESIGSIFVNENITTENAQINEILQVGEENRALILMGGPATTYATIDVSDNGPLYINALQNGRVYVGPGGIFPSGDVNLGGVLERWGTAYMTNLDLTGNISAEDYYSGDGSHGMTGVCKPKKNLVIKDGLVINCN